MIYSFKAHNSCQIWLKLVQLVPMDLFAESEKKNFAAAAPLAVRMRPRTLNEFVGQESFIGKGKLLWRMLEADRLTSLIFFGSPGSGKTTLANIIARQSTADFIPANAATIGVAKIRKIMQAARDTLAVDGRKTVLFFSPTCLKRVMETGNS